MLSRGKQSRDGEMREAGLGERSSRLGERALAQGKSQGAEIEMEKWI